MAEHDKIIYLNGAYLPISEATVSIEDRGSLFADGVYEVVRYYAGRPFALDQHLARLKRSLAGIELAEPEDVARLGDISLELIRQNGIPESKVYWHITRGSAMRRHEFPADTRPTVLAITYHTERLLVNEPLQLWKASLEPDQRWSNCWIKSLMLLPNVLAKNRAASAGCQEAILHRDGFITEGTTTNLFMIKDNVILTHPADQWILGGITRQIIIELIQHLGIELHEQSFNVEELLNADEIFLCGTTTHVAAVTQVDDRLIGLGKAGKLTNRIHDAFCDRIRRDCGLS